MNKTLRVQLIAYTVLSLPAIAIWAGGFYGAKHAYAKDYEEKRPTINAVSRVDAYRQCNQFISTKRITEGWNCKEYKQAHELMDTDLFTPIARWASGTSKGDILHTYSDIGVVVPTRDNSMSPAGVDEGPTFYFDK